MQIYEVTVSTRESSVANLLSGTVTAPTIEVTGKSMHLALQSWRAEMEEPAVIKTSTAIPGISREESFFLFTGGGSLGTPSIDRTVLGEETKLTIQVPAQLLCSNLKNLTSRAVDAEAVYLLFVE